MFGRDKIQIKTPAQIRHMRQAGLVVADIHDALKAAIAPRSDHCAARRGQRPRYRKGQS